MEEESYTPIPDFTGMGILSLKFLNNKNQQIWEIDIDNGLSTEITLNAVVGLTNALLNNLKYFQHYFIDLNIFDSVSGAYIWSQRISLPVQTILTNNVHKLKISFKFTVNKSVKVRDKLIQVNNIKLLLSHTSKHLDEMGHSESSRMGTFFTTELLVKDDANE